MMGNFNLPSVMWSFDPPVALSLVDGAFLDFFAELGLIHHGIQPTYIRSGHKFDSVLSAVQDNGLGIEVLPPLLSCAHGPVSFSIPISHQVELVPTQTGSMLLTDQFWGDYLAISQVMEMVDWFFEFAGRDLGQDYIYYTHSFCMSIHPDTFLSEFG